MKPLWEPLWDDAQKRAEAFKATFTSVAGELVLEDLKRTLNFYSTTFDPNPQVAAFNEGKRAVVAAIVNTMVSADMPKPPQAEDEETDG